MLSLNGKTSLANGVTISINDQTRQYYGDFYLVKLEVVCTVAVPDDDGSAPDILPEKSVTYRRFLEQMGVPSTELTRVKERLLSHFAIHSLSYLAAQNFPAKLVASELTKARKRLGQHLTGKFNE